MAWLLEIETDSILIKEKRIHLSKTSDRVSKMFKWERLSLGFRERSHRSIYRYTKLIQYRIISYQIATSRGSDKYLLFPCHLKDELTLEKWLWLLPANLSPAELLLTWRQIYKTFFFSSPTLTKKLGFALDNLFSYLIKCLQKELVLSLSRKH